MQQGRAFAALAAVQTAAQGAGWPEAMRLDLFGCKTPEDRMAWEARWAAVLSGQASGTQPPRPCVPPPRRGGWQL